MENIDSIGEQKDVDSVESLLSQFPNLYSDPYAREVIKTGIADSGKPITNLRDFLEIRSAIVKVDMMKEKDPETYAAAFVVHSMRPDIEQRASQN